MSALFVDPMQWIEQLKDNQSDWEEVQPPITSSAKDGDQVRIGFTQCMGKKIAVIAHDNRVLEGYLTSLASTKIIKMMDLAEQQGLPIISLYASPGVSIKQGLPAGDNYAKVLRRTCELSGILPQFCGIMGVNVGGPAYSAVLQDLVVFNKRRSHMMVSAPGVVQSVMGEEVSLEDLGGSKLHSTVTGLAHFVEKNPKSQIHRLKSLIDFFPSNYLEDPTVRTKFTEPAKSASPIPKDHKLAYSAHELIQQLVDVDISHEYLPAYGQSMVTTFARVGGYPVGILASNPMHMSGALSTDSSEKCSRFLDIADAYNIPIITLIDTPGFFPGQHQERQKLLKLGAQLCKSMQMRNARLSIVLRKNYGAAAIVLTQGQSWGGDGVIALQNSSCAIMGFDAAKNIIFGVNSDQMSEAEVNKLRDEYKINFEDPQKAYAGGYVDKIINFDELRTTMLKFLKDASRMRPKSPYKVRGIQP